MRKRITIAMAAILISMGSAFGQDVEPTPVEEPAVPSSLSPSPPSSPSFLMPFLPVRNGGPSGQFWFTGDYLMAFERGMNLPDLVTTAVPGTPRATAGIPGTNGTSTLFGGFVNSEIRSGFRLGGGYWFNTERKLGIDTSFMWISSRSANFFANSTDGTILARPFKDADSGLPAAVLVAFPGQSNGSIEAHANSGNFYSFHIDFAETAYEAGWYRLTSLLGYRFYRYDESINVRQIINPIAGGAFPFPAGTQIDTTDAFSTKNSFHGIDMGFRSEFMWRNFTIEAITKVAVGRIARTFTADGQQTISAPGLASITQPGGVLALSSNSGVTGSGDWKVMPEFTATLDWQVRPNITVRFGYTFLLLNSIARAADQIDLTINQNLFPGNSGAGVARPANIRVRSDMWMQTANIGVLFTY